MLVAVCSGGMLLLGTAIVFSGRYRLPICRLIAVLVVAGLLFVSLTLLLQLLESSLAGVLLACITGAPQTVFATTPLDFQTVVPTPSYEGEPPPCGSRP